MDSATFLTWQAHGAPRSDDCVDHKGICYVCSGIMTRGKPLEKWLNSNYTDQNRVASPTSTHVCEACVYVHSRTSPVLGRPPKAGKKFGGNFRNYSHGYDEHGYFNASKGDKELLRNFLARDHSGVWFLAVADSGQKHVLPFAPLNGGGRSGLVIFEEAIMLVPDEQSLIAEMTDLLSSGVTKDEIERGDYYTRTMMENREAVQRFEATHSPHRGGDWFRLAIWLAQRDEEKFKAVESARKAKKNAGRKPKKASRNVGSGDDPEPAKLVPKHGRREAGARLLDTATKQVSSGGEADGDSKRVGQRGPAANGDPVSPQLGLPGLD